MTVVFTLVLFLGGNDTLLRGTGITAADVDVSTGRFHFWPVAVRIFLEHPIFGAGYDSFAVAFTRFDSWAPVSSGLRRRITITCRHWLIAASWDLHAWRRLSSFYFAVG